MEKTNKKTLEEIIEKKQKQVFIIVNFIEANSFELFYE